MHILQSSIRLIPLPPSPLQAGISRFVACHGSLNAFTCQHCGRVRKSDVDILKTMSEGRVRKHSNLSHSKY